MKRIMKIAFTIALVLIATAGFTSGQEKKEKQQIKIVVTGEDGEKIVIDTTFNQVATVDSIRLKGGNVVYIGKGEKLSSMHLSSDENGKVIVIGSDKLTHAVKDGKVMTWVSGDENDEGRSVVYIHKGDPKVKEGEVRYNVEVRSDREGKQVEKTSYVIARDGMVVTIEGPDEAKVKEMASAVEEKLGIKKDGKEDVKIETRKTVKK